MATSQITIDEADAPLIDKLSEPHRDAIRRQISGQDYASIAEASGVAVGTIKSRLFRARQHLLALRVAAISPPATEGEV